ncbi:DegT/DnrJ/EryC1/StrS family aminotransferase [Accumulibacter sp.]|uniref:DegT/DnrJ/EryC1/StrS family aminotransferase n=1 Tax=Accumulibacter sp. TaxID=2053492 RepID=UPI0025DD8063|nr:DegT/DnrJ/EryC1/StrS family aminotransferase [Accumulibacter sp.]MCM8613560.1 DegT/DnrJ/EryC1/StrS family aminotransferase [Accumulibacter sp.]MCM8637257.1 DegT/DnrJ/EryC1/StrS family aminotransferase [Accumulibacter sp.]MCM8638725.1 DegT/DnrJ/EryC1/StrS family aminotransferase [Accumulibacter sp.]
MTPSDGTGQLPRTPLLDWSSFAGARRLTGVHSIDDIADNCLTTSGRAAIYLALLQLRLEPGSLVLIPSYHCPTMVAPVILAGLRVAYFGISADGLPQLGTIDVATAARAKAMLVSHYFGLARSLREVRQWCDARQIALIEDCAHCYFGNAGERPVGTWGDFATASLSKFFPVPEGGVLASAKRPIVSPDLTPQGLRAELKAWADVLESAVTFGRLAGTRWLLAGLFAIKNQIHRTKSAQPLEESTAPPDMMVACDMRRINRTPASTAVALQKLLPRGRIIARRRANYAAYARHFRQVEGAFPLYPHLADDTVPYVFPLWVNDADRVYHSLRALALPVFRWDRIWPDTPVLVDDVGPSWSQHVLQLLCHQDLSEADVTRTALATLGLLSSAGQEPARGAGRK